MYQQIPQQHCSQASVRKDSKPTTPIRLSSPRQRMIPGLTSHPSGYSTWHERIHRIINSMKHTYRIDGYELYLTEKLSQDSHVRSDSLHTRVSGQSRMGAGCGRVAWLRLRCDADQEGQESNNHCRHNENKHKNERH